MCCGPAHISGLHTRALLPPPSSRSRWCGLLKQHPVFLLSHPPLCSQGCLLNTPPGIPHAFRTPSVAPKALAPAHFPFFFCLSQKLPFPQSFPGLRMKSPCSSVLLATFIFQDLVTEAIPSLGSPPRLASLLALIIPYCNQGHLTTGHWAQCLEPTILLGVLENVLF